ncbi:MAG: peptidase, partial [Candidatus Krumholzibacteria bacterium]|nr:peptidase [Candidatus Krumholzibacteria bacterium]
MGENDRAALVKLCLAAKVMDEIFLAQVSEGNAALREKLKVGGDPDLLRFFRINFGPWDRLAADEPVIGSDPKPLGANYYPPDMSREEFEAWLKNHPGDTEAFESNFTVIRRIEGKGLAAVTYSKEYRELLGKAAGYLEEAAELVGSKSLARFLRLRAKAFFSDDYYESDLAWMDVEDNVLDVTIGPYEVYEDKLFNYKAAFEAFICVRDPEESSRLDGLKSYLVRMEKNLPIDDRYKNLERGLESPISVVDEVFSGGDTKAGVQTLAFNLPNDERVREAKGCKKVMLRNICRAKFYGILKPIADLVISPGQIPLVTFDAYFNHILLHEFSHGLGPGRIVLEDGTETTVNKALREAYSAIEETKADVVGQYNFYYLIDDGFFPRELADETAATYLAGFFRSVRFGVEEAHGRANMIAFNYFREKGAYVRDPGTGLWSVDFDKICEAARELSREILMLQALGDYEGAKKFIERYGEMGDDVKESLSRLAGVPVDIEPIFAIEKELP